MRKEKNKIEEVEGDEKKELKWKIKRTRPEDELKKREKADNSFIMMMTYQELSSLESEWRDRKAAFYTVCKEDCPDR